MAFSPNLFLSNVKAKGGLAKPSRFQVIIPIPQIVGKRMSEPILSKLLNFPTTIMTSVFGSTSSEIDDPNTITSSPDTSRYLSLQCEAAELPGKSFTTTDVKIYGPTFKIPTQVAYTDLSLTFLCTNEFSERKLFDTWMETIMSPVTNNFRFQKSDDPFSNYLTQLKIIQYDDFVKQVYAVSLIDAFPVSVNAQQLSWGEDNFHRLTVQFSYQRYRTVYDGQYNVDDVASALFGTVGARVQSAIGTQISNAVGNIF